MDDRTLERVRECSRALSGAVVSLVAALDALDYAEGHAPHGYLAQGIRLHRELMTRTAGQLYALRAGLTQIVGVREGEDAEGDAAIQAVTR